MGIYDREYSRGSEPGYQLSAPQTATMQLLVITVGVYVVQVLFEGVTDHLCLTWDWYRRPWEAYRLITYGFAHDQHDVKHILYNMIALGLFGGQVEQKYGRTKFLAFYLTSIVVGGLIWSLCQSLTVHNGTAVGASAACTGIFLLFALNYPHVEIRMFFMFPMPAWVAALICVALDVHGSIDHTQRIGFTAHLGGAAYAWVFYKYGWVPGLGLMTKLGSWRPRPRHHLRVVRDEDDDVQDEQDDLAAQVDVILQKIKEKGQDSLSWSERKLLERASREYRQKRQ